MNHAPARVQPIILAAGQGKRMGNPNLPKVLTEVGGKSLISHLLKTVDTVEQLLPAAIVVGFQAPLVQQALGDGYTYVTQDSMLGTGHAVACTQNALQGTADAYLVLYGDQPLTTSESIQSIIDEHQRSGAVLTLATFSSTESVFDGFGRVLRDQRGVITGIRERRDCTPEEAAITEYNPALYCFSDAWLWSALAKITPANAQAEYYLTDLLAIALAEGESVASLQLPRWQEFLGVNTPEQLAEVAKWLP
jgi:bifunctional UDP-N-acetylglucosamine pyrophosphorylase / glucosamine-1-phosphate N-acetyltransferase